MNDLKILIATHKESSVPSNEIFLPIQVGKKIAEKKMDFQGDDEGDNISEKNPNYCELTALYWAWKNLKNVRYIGLCHYRRYFNLNDNNAFCKDKTAITTNELIKVNFDKKQLLDELTKYDIILAKPIVYPYDLKFDYCYSHITDDYKIMEDVIKNKFNEYYNSFNTVFGNNKLAHYNMFVTSFSVFNDYSKWIFDVLSEIEKYVKISEYPFQRRVFGYMSERLLMVYCHRHKLKIRYVPVYFVDDTVKQNESLTRYYLKNIKRNILFNLSKIGTNKY